MKGILVWVRGLVVSGLVVWMGLVSGCRSSDTPAEAEKPPVVQAFALTTETQPGQTLSGVVEPRYQSTMSFRVGGKVVERRVDVGDEVAAGTVLMRLEPEDFELALKALKAEITATRSEIVNAKSEVARLQKLYAKNLTSEQTLDRAQNQLNVLQARLDTQQHQAAQTQHQMEYATLRVPDNSLGLVKILEVMVEAGEVVSQGQPVLRLARTTPTEVRVALPESLSTQPPASLRLDLDGQRLTLFLQRLGDQADARSRTWTAWYGLSEKDPNHQAWPKGLRWGETVTLQRPSSEKAWRLPVSALLRRGDRTVAFRLKAVANDGTAFQLEAVPVQVQTMNAQWVWVTTEADIQPGDEVVAFGVHTLQDGQSVRRAAP